MTELLYHLRWSLPFWVVQLLTAWLPENRYATRLRGFMARPFIGRCGKDFRLYIARDCFLNCAGGIRLDDGVVLGPFVVLSTMQQVFVGGRVRRSDAMVRPIHVGSGSWLAAHTVVKCGVRIGSGSAIGANSAVVRDVPDHVLAAGVPAKVIRPIEEREPDAARVIDYLARKQQA
jgi:acetyltransferase-like isoleucine patch superfamily enzyme